MDSSAELARAERTVARIDGADRLRAGVVAVLIGFIGAGLALGPAYGLSTTVAGGIFAAVGGLALVLLAVLLLTTRAFTLGVGGRTRQVWGDAGTAFEIRLKRTIPLGRLLVCGLGAIWLAAGAVALGGGGYVLMVPAVLLALLVPDALVALGRRPMLRFDPAGITYDGWTARASVHWEDVERVEFEEGRQSQPRVMVLVRPGAASFQAHWRRIILPVDRKPKEPGFGLPMAALDEPVAVKVVLAAMVTMSAAARGSYLEYPATVGALTGDRSA